MAQMNRLLKINPKCLTTRRIVIHSCSQKTENDYGMKVSTSYRDAIRCKVQQCSFILHCYLSHVISYCKPSFQCISMVLQAQQEPFSTQILLGPTKLVTKCLGIQMALMLV
jgi:hypothetical protein